MTTRRFGPTLGAGVVVVESESDKPITPARLGVTVMTGIFRKRMLFLSLLEFGYLSGCSGKSVVPQVISIVGKKAIFGVHV